MCGQNLQGETMTPERGTRWAYLFSFVVISVSIVGYFVGMQSPMNPHATGDVGFDDAEKLSTHVIENLSETNPLADQSVVPATHYSDIAGVTRNRFANLRTSLADLKSTVDLNQEIEISEQQKLFALAIRDQNRAFNGAPPTVPHPVDQMTTASCMACHGEGVKTKSFRISRMSHQFLANCTQCHVERNPDHMEPTVFRENSFVGLPAPEGGPRAFAGAPPMIPHSTWMRVDCMSCHGPTGLYGIRSTHPWRQNCQQCHAPSSELDQTLLPARPQFLSPPRKAAPDSKDDSSQPEESTEE